MLSKISTCLGGLLLAGCAASSPSKTPPPDFSKATVKGRLPPEVIQKVVRANFGGMRSCYEEELARDGAIAGRISVAFVIDPNGKVAGAGDALDLPAGADGRAQLAIGEKRFPDPKVTACVVEKFSLLTFPKPEGNGSVTVIYPIIFSPGE